MASFTMAEESRYVATSALVRAQTMKHVGWVFDARRKDERFGQVIEIGRRRVDLTRGAQPIERAALRRWREQRDRAPPVRHLDRFALLDASQQLAGPLSELPDAAGCHVLLIAQPLADAAWCRGIRRGSRVIYKTVADRLYLHPTVLTESDPAIGCPSKVS